VYKDSLPAGLCSLSGHKSRGEEAAGATVTSLWGGQRIHDGKGLHALVGALSKKNKYIINK